jgi:hypothetical protein
VVVVLAIKLGVEELIDEKSECKQILDILGVMLLS